MVDRPSSGSDGEKEESADVSSSEDDTPNLGWLHLPKNRNGKKCRCGSETHQTVSSLACPLNPRNARSDDGGSDDDNSDGGSGDDTSDGGSGDDSQEGDCRPQKRPSSGSEESTPKKCRRPNRAKNNLETQRRESFLRNLRKNSIVEVEYDGKWWKARIMFKYRGVDKWAVKYFDDIENEEGHVEASRIRKFSSV